MSSRLTNRVGLVVLAVLLVAGGIFYVRDASTDRLRVTASFTQTIGLYPGDEVRVLGVPMGTITRITPRGPTVEVEMELDPATPVAADTDAVIVPPGVLSSRYIQLTEPWLSGPKLVDGAELDASRTAAPLELDDVTRQLDTFLAALGPDGANSQGALSDLVSSSAEALDGNGATLRQTLADVADALETLGGSRGDIVATITQLQTFVASLAGSDAAIRTLENGLANVSTQLAGQRVQLRQTITNLARATSALQRFVRRNGDLVTTNVRQLARLTTTLQDRQRELTEITDLAAIGVEGIFGSANLEAGVLDSRVDLTPLLANPDTAICQLLQSVLLPQLCPSTVPDEGQR